jgi:hypothetical protein
MGTGEKKWVPTTRWGFWVAAAIAVIGIAEVFEANTVAGFVTSASSVANNSVLISSFSNTASTTMSASPAASRSVVVEIEFSADSATAESIRSLATNRASDDSIEARPRAVASVETSCRVTCHPAVAATWAIPEPISPAPTTMRCPDMPLG